MPRTPRKGLLSPARREAGDRLVAAGIEGADGHRPPSRPFQRCGDRRWYCSSSSGQPVAVLEQELGAHQADAVAWAGSIDRSSSRLADVDVDDDALAGGGARRRPQMGGVRIPADLRPAPCGAAKFAQGAIVGIEHQLAGLAVERARWLPLRIARRRGRPPSGCPARARQHGDMAGGAAPAERRCRRRASRWPGSATGARSSAATIAPVGIAAAPARRQ